MLTIFLKCAREFAVDVAKDTVTQVFVHIVIMTALEKIVAVFYH